MKLFSFALLFSLLIGRNLPFDQLIFFGLGPWDLVASFFGIILFVKGVSIKGLSKRVTYLAILFLIVGMLGIVANVRFGFALTDVFEVLRVLYGIVLIRVGAYCAHYLSETNIKNAIFFSGALVFYFAYTNPMNPDVLGFVQIWNPNVIGNMLIFHTLLLLIISKKKLDILTTMYCVLLLFFAFFTYSKATWILIVLIIPYLVLNQSLNVKYGLLGLLFLVSWVNSELLCDVYDRVEVLVESKIEASGFDKSASEGSSVGARYGLAYSGFLMFLKSPILGVGIGNYEHVNLMQQSVLDDLFYVDDNANSLVFHYLGTTGFLGFLSVAGIIFYFVRMMSINLPFILTILFFLFIGISVNFQRELFTSNTMWIIMGIISILNKKNYGSFT